MAWTPEKIKQLKKLWQKGKSTVEIARELGISKNAVVGKVHRLGLDARPSPIHSRKTQKPAPATNPSVEKEFVTLMDLKINSCRWPFGDPGQEGFHFCGKECQTGKPYCPEHCKQAYTSLKELALESAKEKKDSVKLVTVSPEEADILEQKKKKPESKSSETASSASISHKEKQEVAAEAPLKKEAKPATKAEKAVKQPKTPTKAEKVVKQPKAPTKEEKVVKPSKTAVKKEKTAPVLPAKADKESKPSPKGTKSASKSEKTAVKEAKPAAKTTQSKGKAVKGK